MDIVLLQRCYGLHQLTEFTVNKQRNMHAELLPKSITIYLYIQYYLNNAILWVGPQQNTVDTSWLIGNFRAFRRAKNADCI